MTYISATCCLSANELPGREKFDKNKKFTHNLLQGSLFLTFVIIGGTKPTTITQISAFPFAQSQSWSLREPGERPRRQDTGGEEGFEPAPATTHRCPVLNSSPEESRAHTRPPRSPNQHVGTSAWIFCFVFVCTFRLLLKPPCDKVFLLLHHHTCGGRMKEEPGLKEQGMCCVPSHSALHSSKSG